MKILITSEFYYPRLGGAELVVQKIAEGLVGRGHLVTVVSSSLPGQPKHHNGVRIEAFKIAGNLARGIRESAAGEVDKYLSLLKSGEFDLIFQYAAQTWHVDLAFPFLGKDGFPPVILAPCGFSGLTSFVRRIFYFNYFRTLKKYVPKYFAVVPHSKEYIDFEFSLNAGAKEIVVIPNGIDSKELSIEGQAAGTPIREMLGLPLNSKVVVTVSNHYELKGHRWLRKLSERKEFKDTFFVIIGGDPGGRTTCYSACLKHSEKLENFIVLGAVSNQKAISLVGEADVFMLLSDLECFPVSVLEALALNKPVVATRVGCLPSFVEEIKLVDRNLDEMSSALQAALHKPFWADEPKLHKFLETYSWKKIVSSYEELFLKAASSNFTP